MRRDDGPKSELRIERLAAVKNLDPAIRIAASARISEELAAFPAVSEARCLLGFAPLPSEPDIAPLLEMLMATGYTVVLPRTSSGTNEMELIELTEAIADLQKDSLGIRVPGSGAKIGLDEIDVALVPGVAFDQQGNRLGRGGGFYDRFLASAARLNTIGICFDLQLLEQIPIEAHDISVDHVSTERRFLADLRRGDRRR